MSLLYYIPSLSQKDEAPIELDEVTAPIAEEIEQRVETPEGPDPRPLPAPQKSSLPVTEKMMTDKSPKNEEEPVSAVAIEAPVVEDVEEATPEVVEDVRVPEVVEIAQVSEPVVIAEVSEVAEAPEAVKVPKPVELPKAPIRKLAPTVGGKAHRRRIDKGRTYHTIKRLSEEKSQTRDRKERSRINAKIRKQRGERENHNQEMEFVDLHGNTIGVVSFEQQNLDDYPDAVCLGKTDNIQAVRFEFVRSTVADETMVRTTALLTEQATKKVIKFIERKTRDKFRSVDPARRGRKHKRSKSDIRKYVQKRTSYVFTVAEFEAHLSTKGRVSIYTTLTDSEMSSISMRRFRKDQKPYERYIRHTNYKVWIDKTQDDFNELIGQTFFGLRQVLDEVL